MCLAVVQCAWFMSRCPLDHYRISTADCRHFYYYYYYYCCCCYYYYYFYCHIINSHSYSYS